MGALSANKMLTTHELSVVDAFIEPARTRNQLIIGVIRYTGCRPKEALEIRRKDLNLEEMSINIRGLKGSNDREIPLPPKFFAALYAHAIQCVDLNPRIFDMKYRRLAQVWAGAGLPKTLKALRHTFATNLYRRTKDIRLTQIALGHKSIENTLVYAHYVDAKGGLRRALINEEDPTIYSKPGARAEVKNPQRVGNLKLQDDWQ